MVHAGLYNLCNSCLQSLHVSSSCVVPQQIMGDTDLSETRLDRVCSRMPGLWQRPKNFSHDPDDWEIHRRPITILYIDEKLTLKELKAEMEKVYDFYAT